MSFQKRLSSGEFVILAQMNTPKGVNISEMVNNARRIKERVHGVIIPDMDNGVMRMSALAGGALMRQQGLEPIMHVYGRDKNRMALQGDILAAYVLGIQNLVVVRGENMSAGDHVQAKTVEDLDELSLLQAIRSLKKGSDTAGFELDGNPDFTVGCTLGSFVDDQTLDQEIEKAQKKIEAGAQFVLSPSVFDMDRFVSFLKKVKGLGVPIIPTVFLLKTVGIARYMATYEPGAFIPEHLIKRMRQSKNREMEGFVIAGETIKQLKSLVQGVQIVTLGWEHRLTTILDYAEL
ncbi:MAG TPA: methylenetetrahydrofolate reductase [Desulfatiglandales bacterium]